MVNKLWLFEWIDVRGITSPASAKRVLADSRSRDRLHEKEVDNLFGKVWHYFDEIVVEGLRARTASRMIENNWQEAAETIESHIRTLLYVRKIGAEDLLIFQQKPSPCMLHYKDHLEETQLGAVLENSTWLIDKLAREGQVVEIYRHDDHWHYTFDHPMLEHRKWGSFLPEKGSTPPKRDAQRAVAEAVFKEYSAHLVTDVRTAKSLDAPLAAAVSLHGHVLEQPSHKVTEAEVALRLALPVLDGVPAAELIKVRRDEALSFERFRQSLGTAIQERLNDAQDSSSVEIATSVVDEVVNPALNDIQQRLGLAQELLAKRSALSLTVGTVTTTIGLIAGMPLLLPAGIAWASLAGQQYLKYLEEKRDIELSDMYFLWRQEQLAVGRQQPR
jgi:hypothetical protein